MLDNFARLRYGIDVGYTYMRGSIGMCSHGNHTRRSGAAHSLCFACGAENGRGLGLVFSACGDGQVTADCTIGEQYQGYPGVVQGGIVAALLDSAMTNCLFSQGVEAMTVRLSVQYREPVAAGRPVRVEAELTRHRGRVYELESSLVQDGSVRASATGKFMVRKSAV